MSQFQQSYLAEFVFIKVRETIFLLNRKILYVRDHRGRAILITTCIKIIGTDFDLIDEALVVDKNQNQSYIQIGQFIFYQ